MKPYRWNQRLRNRGAQKADDVYFMAISCLPIGQIDTVTLGSRNAGREDNMENAKRRHEDWENQG